MSDYEFNKYLTEFLTDCMITTERKRSGRGESDRHFMIKLLDREWYDIAPRAKELLIALKLREVKCDCPECDKRISCFQRKVNCPFSPFQIHNCDSKDHK
jgi:hypothetical protein